MDAAKDTAIFFQLVEILGIPGIMGLLLFPALLLGLLLFLFLRMDQKKWEARQVEDRARWEGLISNHKAERDRDYQHLKELMDANAGHYELITKLLTRHEVTDQRLINLGNAMEKVPELFITCMRDVHSRLDHMMRKESYVPRSTSPERAPRKGEREASAA